MKSKKHVMLKYIAISKLNLYKYLYIYLACTRIGMSQDRLNRIPRSCTDASRIRLRWFHIVAP